MIHLLSGEGYVNQFKKEGIFPLKNLLINQEISWLNNNFIRTPGSSGKILRHINDLKVLVKLPSGLKKVFPSSTLAAIGPSRFFFLSSPSSPTVRRKAKNPHSQ